MIGYIILGVSIFLVMSFMGWIIGTYNILAAGKVNIGTQLSNIKTEYQRRADLFYNLIESVKSYKKFEKSTLEEVTKARNPNYFGKGFGDVKKQLGKLDNVFSKLMLVFERYPNLKANEQHNKLMEEIRITEDRINVARTDYNDVVREYNLVINIFPSNLIASMFRFAQEEFFANEEGTSKAPKISLD